MSTFRIPVTSTMEYLPGGPLRRRNGQPRSGRRHRASGGPAALDHIHFKQIVHRDIKTHNILLEHGIGAERSVPRVKVSDFGIVKTTDSEINYALSGFAGSLGYLAPEQLSEGHTDPRSDLYSLGVVLYELLSGRLPFQPPAPDCFREWRRTRPSMVPDPLDRLRPELPAPLIRFVHRLIDSVPERRFSTAAAAFDELRGSCASTASEHLTALPPLARSSYLAPPCFVGRSGELSALESALGRALGSNDEPEKKLVLCLRGEAGDRKDSILRRAIQGLEAMGALICMGSCRSEGVNAFEPLASLFALCGLSDPRSPINIRSASKRTSTDQLASAALVDSTVVGPSEFRSGWQCGADVATATPREGSDAVKPAAPPWQHELDDDRRLQNWHLYRHVADTVLGLARVRPFALVLEDAHWADGSTLELLVFLVRSIMTVPSGAKRFPIAILLTCRPTPEPAGLRALEEAAHGYGVYSRTDVLPLDASATRELVAAMLMSKCDATVELLSRWLLEHAEGNPLYVAQMLNALHTNGRLIRVGEQWRVELEQVPSAELPTTIRRAIGDRASRFATNTKRMLVSAAVLGREFDLTTLAGVSGIEPLVVLDCLDEAIRADFVLEVEGDPEPISVCSRSHSRRHLSAVPRQRGARASPSRGRSARRALLTNTRGCGGAGAP